MSESNIPDDEFDEEEASRAWDNFEETPRHLMRFATWGEVEDPSREEQIRAAIRWKCNKI